MNAPSYTVREPPRSVWREPAVWLAVLVALALRAVALLLGAREPGPGMEINNVRCAATLASGRGFIMATGDAEQRAEPGGVDVIQMMKRLEARGERIDAEHPYPRTTDGWIPVTVRPAGYPLLMSFFYRIGNYTGMVASIQWVQVVLDALTCLLLFLFARNIFGRRVGIAAAWLYALLLPAIVQVLGFIPDTMSRFLAALILCVASYARGGRVWASLATGAAVGLAFHFRPEFLLIPAALFVVLWIERRRFWSCAGSLALMTAAVLVVLSPWVLWVYRTTHRVLLTTTSVGSNMYQALGQLPDNPWGIVLDDDLLTADAVRHGFRTAWDLDGSDYYYRRFKECVRERPGYYARLVLLHRLPYVLVPPYRKWGRVQSVFSDTRVKEGLPLWRAIPKYPGLFLRDKWSEILITLMTLALLCGLVGSVFVLWRRWNLLAWLLLPWGYFVTTICLTKQVEARNISAIIAVQTVALAVLIVALRDRRQCRIAGTPLPARES
jgi:hypothetical protein